MNGHVHKLVVDAASMRDSETAVLVLRLGQAANTIRSLQRFYVNASEGGLPGPGQERDRVEAFLLACAFLHEARALLQPNFKDIEALAVAGRVDQSSLAALRKFLSGTTKLGRAVKRMRNKLVFHWDEDETVRWVQSRKPDDRVVWAESFGTTKGEMFYRAAIDVVASSIADEYEDDQSVATEALSRIFEELLPATQDLLRVVDAAHLGYWNSVDATVESS